MHQTSAGRDAFGGHMREVMTCTCACHSWASAVSWPHQGCAARHAMLIGHPPAGNDIWAAADGPGGLVYAIPRPAPVVLGPGMWEISFRGEVGSRLSQILQNTTPDSCAITTLLETAGMCSSPQRPSDPIVTASAEPSLPCQTISFARSRSRANWAVITLGYLTQRVTKNPFQFRTKG